MKLIASTDGIKTVNKNHEQMLNTDNKTLTTKRDSYFVCHKKKIKGIPAEQWQREDNPNKHELFYKSHKEEDI